MKSEFRRTSGHFQNVLLFASSERRERLLRICEMLDAPAQTCLDVPDLGQMLDEDLGMIVIDGEALGDSMWETLRHRLKIMPNGQEIPVLWLGPADDLRPRDLEAQILPADLPEDFLQSAMRVLLRTSRGRQKLWQQRRAFDRVNSEFEKVNRAKSVFLANMSHEIRTPISAIMGFSELAARDEASPTERGEYLNIIQRNTRQLLQQIDDLLDLANIEAGRLVIERTRVRLADFLFEVATQLQSHARDKSLEAVVDVTTAMPEFIVTDPYRLKQILWNVLGNAIKFTPQGSVILKIAFDRGQLKFDVIDTGIGILPGKVAQLFQPFGQADSSTTRRYGGTGLGLALSRRLAGALGGTLELYESRLGLGSEFRLTVDAAVPEGTRISPTSEAPKVAPAPEVRRPLSGTTGALAGLKVLLVEDSADNQMLISTLLRHHGAQIEVRGNGEDGSEAALHGAYDVVLMDVHMPIMDGHAATRRLRELNYEKPIVALTAHARNEERIRCLASGFTEYLTKPIQMPVLLSVLNRYKMNSHHP